MSNQIRYTEETTTYNERRYGKPWMAIITTSTTKDFSFIDWEGRPGSSGEFSFTAEPGTLLAYGQKDFRKGRGGIDGYQICLPNGTMPVISDTPARKLNKLPISERPEAMINERLSELAKEVADNELKSARDGISDYDRNYYTTIATEKREKIEAYQLMIENITEVSCG